jgi:hypothetical protein
MTSILDDGEHWRMRARQTAHKAEMAWTTETKQRLLKIAEEYQAIARRAELAELTKERESTPE